MSEQIQAQCSEITFVESSQVTCDGPKTGHHPRVFLTLKGGVDDEVVCPYCSHVFRSTEAKPPVKNKPTAIKKAPAKKAVAKKTTKKKPLPKKATAKKKAAPKKRTAKRKAS